jgi:hypothetical protein
MTCGGTTSPNSVRVVPYPCRAPYTAPPSTWRAMTARTTGCRPMRTVVEDVLDNAGPVIALATAMWARDNVPPAVLALLRQAADAVQAGGDAMATFAQGELLSMEPLAGMLRDDPEWIRGILAVAEQLGEI